MPLEIKLLSSDEFDASREAWNELLGRSSCTSVFLRWEWMHTWWKDFPQSHRRLFILAARREGRLMGFAPFYIETQGLHRTRTLRWCSVKLSPDYLDIVAEEKDMGEFAQAVVKYLKDNSGEWDLIDLDNMRAESVLLSDPAHFAGYLHTLSVSHQCPHITIDRPFDDYYKERPELSSFSFHKKLRYLFEQKKVKHTIVSDEKSLAKGLDDLFLLHEKRARQMNVKSNFMSEPVKKFHLEVARLFYSEKILSLHFLYDGETPVSAYYAFVYGGKEFLYQTGFDPAYSKWSAGAVLLFLCVHRAFDDGLKEFDFLKGTETYKKLWSTGVRKEMQLIVYNRNLRGTIWRVMRSLKSTLHHLKHNLLESRLKAQKQPS